MLLHVPSVLDPGDLARVRDNGYCVTRGEVFPVACGVATKNLGTHALLDLIVEGVPSPANILVGSSSARLRAKTPAVNGNWPGKCSARSHRRRRYC